MQKNIPELVCAVRGGVEGGEGVEDSDIGNATWRRTERWKRGNEAAVVVTMKRIRYSTEQVKSNRIFF